MRVIQDDLWLCGDCTIAAVNGDFTALDFHYGEPEATERQHDIVAGLEDLGPHLVPDFEDWGDGHEEFAAMGCDCCRSGHAGEMRRFAVLGGAS